jgi:hypothetical protein
MIGGTAALIFGFRQMEQPVRYVDLFNRNVDRVADGRRRQNLVAQDRIAHRESSRLVRGSERGAPLTISLLDIVGLARPASGRRRSPAGRRPNPRPRSGASGLPLRQWAENGPFPPRRAFIGLIALKRGHECAASRPAPVAENLSRSRAPHASGADNRRDCFLGASLPRRWPACGLWRDFWPSLGDKPITPKAFTAGARPPRTAFAGGTAQSR